MYATGKNAKRENNKYKSHGIYEAMEGRNLNEGEWEDVYQKVSCTVDSCTETVRTLRVCSP
jgi:hypothetical protein